MTEHHKNGATMERSHNGGAEDEDESGYNQRAMSDLDLTTSELTTKPDPDVPDPPAPDPLAGVSTERLLETALERLAGSTDRTAAIAQASIEEALRQLRKARRPTCGGESDAR